MSLPTHSPLIMDWIQKGFKWKYVWQPNYRPLTIPARGEIRVPRGDFTYTAYEGILLSFLGIFDSPFCGIRINTPQLDTKESFTVNNMSLWGNVNLPYFVNASIPPAVADGTYVIQLNKEWPWTEWSELSLINTDTVEHTTTGFAYTMALLTEKRPPEILETYTKLMLGIELYPDLKARVMEIIKADDFTRTLLDLAALKKWDAIRKEEEQ